MSKLFYTDIDLKSNQLLNPVLHASSTAPSNPKAGQMYYNTSDHLTYQYDGSNWIIVTGSIADLAKNDNRVVTSVSTTNGRATLGTTGIQEIKLGVALPKIGTATTQSLQQVFETIDVAIDNRVKRNNLGTSEGLILVTSGTGGDTATTTGFSIQSTALNPASNTEVPTSKAVATYVGNLAGGLDYKGVLDWSASGGQQVLPTTGVKNGDIWMVAKDTDATHHYQGNETAYVGDLYVASVNSGNVTWDLIPIEFTVTDNGIAKLAPGAGLQTIAIVDGHNITLGLQNITVSSTPKNSYAGNAVNGVEFDANNVATLSKTKVLQTVYTKSGSTTGVVTNVEQITDGDGLGIQVTTKSLLTAQPANLQYVNGLSQAADGQLTISAGQFDQTLNATTGAHTNIAPSTKATKDYVDNFIDSLDSNVTIVTKDGGQVYLQQVVYEANGKLNLTGSDTYMLQVVASTGQAVDVKFPHGSNGSGIPGDNVLTSLQGLQNSIQSLDGDVVKRIGGLKGDVKLGNGLSSDSASNYINLVANDYVEIGPGGIQLVASRIDNKYLQTAKTNLATVESIQTAIDGLDVTVTGMAANKTVATLTQTDGKIAATFQNISIASSQINDKQDTYSGTDDRVVTGKAVKAAIDTLDVTEASLSDGSNSEIKIYGIYETNGLIGIQSTDSNIVKSWKLQSTYSTTNPIALQSTVDERVNSLDGSHNVATFGTHSPTGTQKANYKIDLFDATQTDGKVSTNGSVAETIYITKAFSATNPLITLDDLADITGAMVYRDTVTRPNNAWVFGSGTTPSALKTGDVFVVGTGGFTLTADTNLVGVAVPKGTYEAGDMLIYNGSVWTIVSGENQVSNNGTTILVGSGLQNIATVDGTVITAGASVTRGIATIATVDNNVITLHSGLQQLSTSGTIANDTSGTITLKKVAMTALASDVNVTNGSYGDYNATGNTGTVQLALQGIQSVLTTVDGYHGNIKTGNGLTDVAGNNGTFGINIDSNNANGLYLSGSTEGSKQLAMYKATGSQFGTVEVTAGNGLSISNGVVSYAHNTTAVTIASKSGNVVTLNGTFTPNASDAITMSNPITFDDVAITGAAADVSIEDAGNLISATTVEGALQEIANNVANSMGAKVLASPAITLSGGTGTWNINVTGFDTGEKWEEFTIVELRDSNKNIVEADISYNTTNNKIVIKVNGTSNYTAGAFTLVAHTKNKYTIANA